MNEIPSGAPRKWLDAYDKLFDFAYLFQNPLQDPNSTLWDSAITDFQTLLDEYSSSNAATVLGVEIDLGKRILAEAVRFNNLEKDYPDYKNVEPIIGTPPVDENSGYHASFCSVQIVLIGKAFLERNFSEEQLDCIKIKSRLRVDRKMRGACASAEAKEPSCK